MTEPASETPDVADVADMAVVATGRRGRPRPNATLERDEKIYALITGPKTRAELMAETGLRYSEVYLSLHRLRVDGRVTRTHTKGAHAWVRVTEQLEQ